MGEDLVVRIPKCRFWLNSEQYAIYPQILAEGDLHRTYTTKEFKEDLLGLIRREDKKGYHNEDLALNWRGLILGKEGEVVINGLPLLEKIEGNRFILTKEAKELGSAYSAEPMGIEWKLLLGELLLKYSLHLRSVTLPLAQGARLIFPGDPSLFWKTKKSYLILLALKEERLPIFTPKKVEGKYILEEVMRRYSTAVIGPFWREKMLEKGVDQHKTLVLKGMRGETISMVKLSSELKPVFLLLYDLGLMKYFSHDGGWGLDSLRLRYLFSSKLYEDYFLEETISFEYVLKTVYSQVLREDGFIRTEDLREAFALLQGGEDGDLEEVFNRMLFHQKIEIIDYYRGFASDGPGLWGDSKYQFIQLKFKGDS